MKTIEQIHACLQQITNYPAGVSPVVGRIAGTAFFPGGDGLWKEEGVNDDLTIGGIMVVGHNFDNVSGFQQSLARGSEPVSCATWRNITMLLREANIVLTRCFFTNVYVGLMETASNVGKFPGAKSAAFRQQCVEFLQQQIALQQPSLILTLGAYVPPLIASLSPQLASWQGIKRVGQLDANQTALIKQAAFCAGSVHANVLALTHPAQRHLNVGRRHYLDITGHAAELALLQEAQQSACAVC